jgi:hypothetical protein
MLTVVVDFVSAGGAPRRRRGIDSAYDSLLLRGALLAPAFLRDFASPACWCCRGAVLPCGGVAVELRVQSPWPGDEDDESHYS